MAEDDPQTTPPDPERDDESLLARMREVAREVATEVLSAAPKGTAKTGGRRTYRDEEEDMASLVESKITELLRKEKASGEHHPEPGETKAPPEPVPAQPQAQPEKKRRVESFMGF